MYCTYIPTKIVVNLIPNIPRNVSATYQLTVASKQQRTEPVLLTFLSQKQDHSYIRYWHYVENRPLTSLEIHKGGGIFSP